MPEWLQVALVGIAVPLILRLIPNKRLTGVGAWLAYRAERGRYRIYLLGGFAGRWINRVGTGLLGTRLWEKVEGKTLEAIFKGFIEVEDRAPWSAPTALAFGLVDGWNEGEEGYQKRGPGLDD